MDIWSQGATRLKQGSSPFKHVPFVLVVNEGNALRLVCKTGKGRVVAELCHRDPCFLHELVDVFVVNLEKVCHGVQLGRMFLGHESLQVFPRGKHLL